MKKILDVAHGKLINIQVGMAFWINIYGGWNKRGGWDFLEKTST